LERNAKITTGQVMLLVFIGDRVVFLVFLWYSAKGLLRRNVLVDLRRLPWKITCFF